MKIANYVKESYTELVQKVSWPTMNQLSNSAVIVMTASLIFALVVSHVFFGWTLTQCVTCALTGMVAELLCEVVFSYFGYATCRAWKREGVGNEYFAYLRQKKEKAL